MEDATLGIVCLVSSAASNVTSQLTWPVTPLVLSNSMFWVMKVIYWLSITNCCIYVIVVVLVVLWLTGLPYDNAPYVIYKCIYAYTGTFIVILICCQPFSFPWTLPHQASWTIYPIFRLSNQLTVEVMIVCISARPMIQPWHPHQLQRFINYTGAKMGIGLLLLKAFIHYLL